jgi:hypothetical protein
MTGPPESEEYFRNIDSFIGAAFGPDAQSRYEIIIDEPEQVAQKISNGLEKVRKFRRDHGDAYYCNWRLKIDHDFQMPFQATHDSMRELELCEDLSAHVLAGNLRRVFSGIVSGNVREDTIAEIEQSGPLEVQLRSCACSMTYCVRLLSKVE